MRATNVGEENGEENGEYKEILKYLYLKWQKN